MILFTVLLSRWQVTGFHNLTTVPISNNRVFTYQKTFKIPALEMACPPLNPRWCLHFVWHRHHKLQPFVYCNNAVVTHPLNHSKNNLYETKTYNYSHDRPTEKTIQRWAPRENNRGSLFSKMHEDSHVKIHTPSLAVAV